MKLRTRLFQLILAAVVPLLVLSFVLGWLLIQHEKNTLRDGALERVRAFMTEVDAEIEGHMSTLKAVASSRSLEAGDLRAFYVECERFLESQPDWQNLLLSLPSGQQVVNARRPLGSKLPMNADMETTARIVASLEPTVGNLTYGRASRKYGVSLRVPVMKDGKLVYILTASIDPEAFGKLMREQNLPEGWVSGLIDSSGQFIARIPPRQVMDKASPGFMAAVSRSWEGWYRGLTVEKVDTYTAHLTSRASGWSIGLAIPAREVNYAAIHATWVMLLATLVVLSIALGLAWWMSTRITQPITALGRAARALGSQPDIPVVEDAPGIDELREVASALRDASRAIHERQSLIEREQAALREADRAKDDFLAMLGHELRNPLGAIAASAQVLPRVEPASEMAQQAQATIERQTKHMTRLVEDLLDISGVAMGKVSLQREVFNLSELAARVIETWKQTRSGGPRPVSLAADEEVWVDADRARMEQVLANLLNNSDKFSPPGAAVRIRISRDRGQAVMELADRGEGIEPELLETVFNLFVQGPHGPDRARGGMGIGLALVKRIVDMHGGSVAAASDGTGQGATFTIRLPAAAKPHGSAPETSGPRLDNERRRILVIEDNDDTRYMTLVLLQLEGHDVRAAPDGASGIALAQEWHPDVVLVDIGLPDMEGHEVARRLRASGAGRPAMRLVAVTGYGQAEDRRLSMEAGFDMHLTKPASIETLRMLLSTMHS